VPGLIWSDALRHYLFEHLLSCFEVAVSTPEQDDLPHAPNDWH